jgi:hypothetical protein
MLPNKSTKIISELHKYFSSDEKTISTLLTELQSLKISNQLFTGVDKINTKYSGKQKLILLLLFPIFAIKDISHYIQSPLFQLYKTGKDVFYEFINHSFFDWRKLSFQISKQLISRVEKSSFSENKPISCLIADDTDFPKRGKHFELLSRIYSHVTHTFNYGFKGLFLGYHDGKSFFGLDFSLHGEKGKDKNKPYGLTKKQSKSRFNTKRNKKSYSQERVNEYFETKTSMLISMIRRAIAQGIHFDYLLTDSWFTNFELIKFIATRRIGCFFLGMVKNGNTKYIFNGKELSFGEILKKLKHTQKADCCKKLRCKFYEAIVELKGVKIKLFFCKTTKKGKWHGLLTTNTKLNFEKAYQIYSTRWTIEVFFKESKQLLRLGKCESLHFEAHIAATTICMLQYNLLSAIKRFDGYESLGVLFRQANAETLELTIKERIWLVIIEILTELAEYLDFEIDFLLEHIFAGNEKLTKLINLKSIAESA